MKSDQKIRNLAKDICKLAVQAATLYSIETDVIIVSGCRDKNRIECTLDGMLDFCFDKNVLELYRRLCRYYYDIDQYSAVEYVNAYRDMWDQECKSFGGVKLKSSLPAIEEIVANESFLIKRRVI